MRVIIVILSPATRAIEFVVRWILKFTPSTKDDEANILAAHEEIRGTIDLQTKEGTVARHDANTLGGVLDLGELQVADVMVHRTKMETFDIEDPPQRIVDESALRTIPACPSGRTSPRTSLACCIRKIC